MDSTQPSNEALLLLVGRPGRGREALEELLRAQAGPLSISCADSGLLALKFIRQNQPRAAIIAGGLPESEVVELIVQLKQHHPRLPCLALAESAEVQREAMLAGADWVMPIGSSWGQLLPIVRQILE